MYDMGMIGLATFQVTDFGGKEYTLRAVDFRRAEKISGGSLLFMADNPQPYLVSSTPDDIHTAINALWDEWLNAFPA